MATLEKGRIVRSPVSGKRYRLGDVIGVGGYGKAFRATELGKKRRSVCLKYTFDQASWHRESYFGELLRGNTRVIQMYDSFPVMPRSGRGRIRYCLVLELAEHGTVADYTARTGKPYSEGHAKREILALLRILDSLHGGSATHRDITPFNIFVCAHGVLKLGDFGIARHEIAGFQRQPEAFNEDFVTRGVIDAEHRAWTAVDDVFQMGQLLAMLVLGRREKVTRAQIRRAKLSPELKAVIRRAIGERSRRYADAWDMMQALRGDPTPPNSRLKTLRGKTIAFSGPLSITRFDLEILAATAGARVARRITREVDVIVQGRGRRREGSSKLLAAQRLIREGRRIQVIGEAEFRRLVRH